MKKRKSSHRAAVLFNRNYTEFSIIPTAVCSTPVRNYQEATKGFINSYSKKAYPWDNACIESFHSLLKREWINRFKIIDYKHAYKLVFECIEAFYNTVRSHSHCGYVFPDEHESNYLDNMEMNVRKIG